MNSTPLQPPPPYSEEPGCPPPGYLLQRTLSEPLDFGTGRGPLDSGSFRDPDSFRTDSFRTESRPYDSTQEIRAMVLAALPYPPLPVIVECLDEDNRVGGERVQTSHDLLANLLLHACAKKDRRGNEERRVRQTRVLRSLVDHMANRGQLQSVPELYETYCHHTRLHVASYTAPGGQAPPPLRFAPLSSVCKGDPTHRRMCDYMAGQAVLLEEPNGHSAQDWLCREYADMLTINRARILCQREPGLTQEDEEAAEEEEERAESAQGFAEIHPDPGGRPPTPPSTGSTTPPTPPGPPGQQQPQSPGPASEGSQAPTRTPSPESPSRT